MRGSGHGLALGLFGGVLVLWLAVMAWLMHNAALPPEASGTMLAVFDPATSQERALATIIGANAKVLRKSGVDFVWVVNSDEPGLAGRLKENGALGAYRELPISPALAGCFAVADAKVSAAFDQ